MDVALFESGNGGDIRLQGTDLVLYFFGENNPYLAMFGGNPGFITGPVETQEQSFDWWGNRLLSESFPTRQFNSYTEQAFKDNPLNSAGRVAIEAAIKKDLQYLQASNTITVEVSIVSDDWVTAKIKISNSQISRIKIVNFRKSLDGDFKISDFNDDFNV